jgi:hypothetical protein
MAWYYIIQAAYNLDAIISLIKVSFAVQLRWPVASSTKFGKVISTTYIMYDWQSPIKISWSNTIREDFKELAFHDVLTNALCLGSSFCRITRAGSLIFLVHDVSAVTVKISKISNFMQWKQATLAAFTVMLMTWAVTRLYILPFIIVRGALSYQHYVLQEGLSPMFYICYRHMFDTALVSLCLLQVYWFNSYAFIYIRLLKKTFNPKQRKTAAAQKKQQEACHVNPITGRVIKVRES